MPTDRGAEQTESEAARPTARQVEMLRRIEKGDVSWRSDLGGRISYRLWSSERDYKLVTPAVKRLVARGWAKGWHNQSSFGRGGVELTRQGHEVARHAD